ncbi:hypothetical protein [Nocardia shimofusensis]|uniref:hypothetical protein n=1 Tax=Nocardia shimofusensis TaxID=228596 RepID=UPI0012EE2EAC|nr:hypothetical protein [Nocardia shimofusensis]
MLTLTDWPPRGTGRPWVGAGKPAKDRRATYMPRNSVNEGQSETLKLPGFRAHYAGLKRIPSEPFSYFTSALREYAGYQDDYKGAVSEPGKTRGRAEPHKVRIATRPG